MDITRREGTIKLFSLEDRPIEIRTVGSKLKITGCDCLLEMDASNGRILKWKGPANLRGVILAHVYQVWPELKKGEFKQLRLKPKSNYTFRDANIMAATAIAFAWGCAATLAVLFPVQTVTSGFVSIIEICLFLAGIGFALVSYVDYFWYHHQYGLAPEKPIEKAPINDVQSKVMRYEELQKIWNSSRPLTMEDGKVYRIFDRNKVRKLRQLESRLDIKLPFDGDSGWALVGVNDEIAQEHQAYLQTRPR